MPSTPIYALPYPAATDPADVPTDMQELADRLELVFPGKELAYAQIVAPVTPTGTTEATATVIVTAPAVTFDGSTTVIIEFFSQSVASPTGPGSMTMWLFQDGASIGRLNYLPGAAGAVIIVPMRVARRLTPAAGSHIYSVRIHTTGGGNVSAGPGGAGADSPAFIRITRV